MVGQRAGRQEDRPPSTRHSRSGWRGIVRRCRHCTVAARWPCRPQRRWCSVPAPSSGKLHRCSFRRCSGSSSCSFCCSCAFSRRPVRLRPPLWRPAPPPRARAACAGARAGQHGAREQRWLVSTWSFPYPKLTTAFRLAPESNRQETKPLAEHVSQQGVASATHWSLLPQTTRTCVRQAAASALQRSSSFARHCVFRFFRVRLALPASLSAARRSAARIGPFTRVPPRVCIRVSGARARRASRGKMASPHRRDIACRDITPLSCSIRPTGGMAEIWQ